MWLKAFKWFSIIMFLLSLGTGILLIIYAGIAPDTHEKVEVERGGMMAIMGLLFLFISMAISTNMRVWTLKRQLKKRET